MADENKKKLGINLELNNFFFELSLIKIKDVGGFNYFMIYTGLFQILSLLFVNNLDFDWKSLNIL